MIGAGLIFLPLLLPSFLAPLVGKYADLHGPRLPVFIGFVLGTPFVVLLILVGHSGIRQIVLLCALLALLGLSYPMVITAILAEFTYTVNAEEKKRGEGCFGEMGPYAQAVCIHSFTRSYSMSHLCGGIWAPSLLAVHILATTFKANLGTTIVWTFHYGLCGGYDGRTIMGWTRRVKRWMDDHVLDARLAERPQRCTRRSMHRGHAVETKPEKQCCRCREYQQCQHH